jgi:nitroimidazol reductase NimA-like FMN-containing flavoprotein (pyridoxamine 5'-phosphate oxidase superfamily)
MNRYHLRKADKEITDAAELDRILSTTRYIALAMCSGNDPYLVILNHGYDAALRRIYFHCTAEGKKIDFMRANPRVWGVAFEDLGYQPGRCDHSFRSVMFGGKVHFADSFEEKKLALEMMIRQQEPDPESMFARLLTVEKIRDVAVGVIEIEEMSGKESSV